MNEQIKKKGFAAVELTQFLRFTVYSARHFFMQNLQGVCICNCTIKLGTKFDNVVF